MGLRSRSLSPQSTPPPQPFQTHRHRQLSFNTDVDGAGFQDEVAGAFYGDEDGSDGGFFLGAGQQRKALPGAAAAAAAAAASSASSAAAGTRQRRSAAAPTSSSAVASSSSGGDYAPTAALAVDPFKWQRQHITLPEITLAGPLELVFPSPVPLTLFIPHSVEAPSTRRLLVAPGAALTLRNIRGVSLRRPVELPKVRLPVGGCGCGSGCGFVYNVVVVACSAVRAKFCSGGRG